jgi:hypothetical protein
MGGGYYSGDVAERTRATRTEHFTYRGHDVSSGKATRSEEKKCHKDLSPFKSDRECRDNPEHPQTTPIVVGLDVTRSRGDDAKIVFEKLPMFFGQICLKGYVPDPTISFSAVGDATFGDLAPVQIGQFEADNRLDEVLSHVWLEEGGGGTGQESYQLLAYYYARHCLLDSWEKRQKKGFFFMSGDEGFYPQVSKGEVARVFGDKLSEDIASQQIFRELQEKFHTFLIYPRSSWQERQADIDEEIRQRVLRAGGRVEGVDVRFSLVWHNRNDLDLHVITPSNFEIYYGNKKSPCGGELDVDMNIHGETTKPVENVRWVKNKAPKGTYRVFVQNYGFHEGNRKETPFKVEIEINGQVQHFEGVTAKDKSGPSSNVMVGEFKFDPNQRIDVDEGQKYAGYDEKLILSQWAGVLPETNILLIDDPKAIVDLMLGVLAMVGNGSSLEQYLDDMKDRQQTPKRIAEVKKALLPLSESLKISKVTMPESVGAGRKSGSRKSKTTRL